MVWGLGIFITDVRFCISELRRDTSVYDGATENAGQENDGQENDGQKSRAGKCRTGK